MVVAAAPVPSQARLWRPLACTALLALVAMAAPGSANHPQTGSGNVVVFDHVTGNEWWVEVALSGQDAGSVAKVEAMDTGGAWVTLAKKSWGPYAASFHIEPGNQVRFRATWSGGAQQVSCWFTHPAGLEQCTTTPPPGAFDATFTGVRGNEWWVQAQVATNGPAIGKVDVRLATNNVWGNWMPVAKQSWGWGSSYHITQGTIIQLRATAVDGQVDLSSCRQWIPPSGQDAQIVACPGGGAAPFDATFTGVKANEWWIQVNVAGNEPITAVAFRTDCSPQWSPLTKQSWGGWAPTYQVHFNEGQKVDFMATSADGDVDASSGYIMRSASPTSGCALGAWPKEGSEVVYDLSSGVCGGGECFHADATLGLTYRSNSWQGTCVGETRHTASDGTVTRESFSTRLDITPLFTRVPTTVGAVHGIRDVGTYYSAKSCGVSGNDFQYTVQSRERHQTAMVDGNHDPLYTDAYIADRDVTGANYMVAVFDAKLGMVIETQSYPRMSGQGSASLYVTDTDAPLQVSA